MARVRAEGEALAELRNTRGEPARRAVLFLSTTVKREETRRRERRRERTDRARTRKIYRGVGNVYSPGNRRSATVCHVIRGLPHGMCSPCERKSRVESSRIYPSPGSPIMSISNTTNCTQRSGDSCSRDFCPVCAHMPTPASSSPASLY